MNGIAKRAVVFSGMLLFGVWMYAHWARIASDEDALIRFTLGILFAVLIIFRRKTDSDRRQSLPGWVVPASLLTGVLATVFGIIFEYHIVEWIGILLLLFACTAWATPARYGRDLVIAFFILYWMHPLPGQIFGWLQMEMQRLSIIGSEMVLHTFNVRVWGDLSSMVLRTGYHDFMVPDSCSGMRTSVTVFLCTIGVGTLLRLRWYETAFFVVLGLVQVLLLNIARISYMVIWAPRMSEEWAENFLHDTLGIFLMVSILLVQLEAAWWQVWSRKRRSIKEGIKNNELERPDKASIVPHSLRRLIFILTIVAAVGLVALGIAGLIYKNRNYHRKEMIREVAEGLLDNNNPDAAYRAVEEALKLLPGDSGLLSLQARIYLVRGQFDKALEILNAKEAAGETLPLEEIIFKSWTLMKLERIGEARGIIDALPAETAEYRPGVAMLKAEFAARDNKPEVVSHYVVLASRSLLMLDRIRRLFPYLAVHEQWDAIAHSDRDRPYEEVYQALIALYANQMIGDMGGVARVMSQAVKTWPDDIRFLPDIYRLVVVRQGGDWEDIFEHNLLANVAEMSVDRLAMVMDYCWRISRPDLAWVVFNTLRNKDADDPALFMAPALYGKRWYLFKRHQLNVESDDPVKSINLLPFVKLFRDCSIFHEVIQRIPLSAEMADMSDQQIRKRYLARCLEELDKREKEGRLTPRLNRMYPTVLVMSERFDDAHRRLDDTLKQHPEQAASIQLRHAVFYNQQGKWQSSYEALRKYTEAGGVPDLRVELLKIQACMNLDLSVNAMDTLERARKVFPNSIRLALAESAIWDVFGFKEQALYIISKTPGGATSPVCVGLLYATGRINAARQLSEATGVPLPPYKPRQLLRLPSATFSIRRHWPPPLTANQRSEKIKKLKSMQKKATSPYIKSLNELEISWHESIAAGKNAAEDEILRWEDAGRDNAEKVGALYRLSMLYAREKNYAEADRSLKRALKLMPSSQILWRARISATAGDRNVVKAAYKECPYDSEVMLTQLVDATGGINGNSNTVDTVLVSNIVERVIKSGDFSAGTMVRAGDWLLSRNQVDQAALLAHAAIPRSRGLLAAYALGIRVALKQKDMDWANVCTISGIENAQDPIPFYRTMVDIKAMGNQVDAYLMEALEYLCGKRANEQQWGEMLGKIYFQKGDMQRSLSIFGSVIKGDTRNVDIGTMILAAEAARRNSKLEKAINILESAYAMKPDELSVLNNLVYLLAQNPNTLSRAQALMPKLLGMGSESFAVMDTAAIVYLRSGDLEKAQKWMNKARNAIKDDSYSAPEVRLNAAEILMRSGKYKEARESIRVLRENDSRTDYIDRKARSLLRDIEALSEGM